MYHNGTTDRSYTINNRQVVHKYGTITLVACTGRRITSVFHNANQQAILEYKYRRIRRERYNNKAQIFLSFQSRMDTNKARQFAELVAREVGFIIKEDRQPIPLTISNMPLAS